MIFTRRRSWHLKTRINKDLWRGDKMQRFGIIVIIVMIFDFQLFMDLKKLSGSFQMKEVKEEDYHNRTVDIKKIVTIIRDS